MLLYLMRHGPAGERGDPAYPDDTQRPLTDEGRRKTRLAARGLRRMGIAVDVVLTSPLVRARQTAEIAATELRLPISLLRESRNLEPGAAAGDLFSELAAENVAGSVLLVGHEPDLSRLTSLLITSKPRDMEVLLKKGAVCLVEVAEMPPAHAGALRFLMQPAQLRAIGH